MIVFELHVERIFQDLHAAAEGCLIAVAVADRIDDLIRPCLIEIDARIRMHPIADVAIAIVVCAVAGLFILIADEQLQLRIALQPQIRRFAIDHLDRPHGPLVGIVQRIDDLICPQPGRVHRALHMQMIAVVHKAVYALGAWILIGLVHVDLQMIATHQFEGRDEDAAEEQKVHQQRRDAGYDERYDRIDHDTAACAHDSTSVTGYDPA